MGVRIGPGHTALTRIFLGGVVECRRLGKADHRVLGGGILPQVLDADQTGIGSGIDDSTTALGEHLANLIFHAQENAEDVDPIVQHEILLGGIGQFGRFAFDACVIERTVQAAEIHHRRLDQRFGISSLRYIAFQKNGLATRFGDQVRGFFTADHIDIGDHHTRTLAGKDLTGRPSDATAAPGYHCYLTRDYSRHDRTPLVELLW